MDLKWFYFSFNGRIGRQQFWLYGVLLFMLLYIVGIGVFSGLAYVIGSEAPNVYITWLLAAVAFFFVFWAGIAIGAKRCHDRDRSGWFQLIQIIPIVGPIWYIIEVGFLKGTTGPNRFGSDPLQQNSNKP